ncbi:hypothetical protein ACNSO8_19465 [Yersinia sp. LJYL362]|uniref:hypothetical protein n=1 Tax=Yersinia sp. LJYL362 TaxID=3402108 RepID=UPI003AB6355F
MSRLVKIKSGESSLILDADRVSYVHEITGGREIIYIDGSSARTPASLDDIAAALIPVTELQQNAVSDAALFNPRCRNLAAKSAHPTQSATHSMDLVKFKQALGLDIESALDDSGKIKSRTRIYLSTVIASAFAAGLKELDITTLPAEDLDDICSIAIKIHMRPHY